MRFFFDNNLSEHLAKGLKEYSSKTQPPFAYKIPPNGTKFVKIDL